MARQTKTFFGGGALGIEMAQSDKATIVKVELEMDNAYDADLYDMDEYSASGTAKRENGDRFDPEVGRNLALARALHSLANKLEKDVAARAFPARLLNTSTEDEDAGENIEALAVDELNSPFHDLVEGLKILFNRRGAA